MFIKEINFSMKLNLGHIKIPFIDDATSDELFRDGRIFGLIAENIVSGFFNLDKIYGCEDHDLENGSFKYEVKCLTKQGLKTCPSYMVGKGRKYNKEEHQKYLESKDGMFIVDITSFPVLTIYYVKDMDKLLFASKSYKGAKALLDELTDEIN